MDVKSIIKARGFRIEEVAKAMGITRVTLSQSLSRNPTVGTLQRIADVIGCKVGDFFREDISRSAPPFFAFIKSGDILQYAFDLSELEAIVTAMKNENLGAEKE